MNTKELLDKAQEKAVEFLKNRGHSILQEGFDFPGFPIEVVTIDDDTLVFVSVAVKDKDNINADWPLTYEDRKRFVAMALAFLATHLDIVEMKVRLDYINFYPMDKRVLIEHHQNVDYLDN